MSERRVVLAGNGRAAILVLELLLELIPVSDVLVLAPPASGTASWHERLADEARRAAVRCAETADINAPDIVRLVHEHRPSLMLSVYFPQLFRSELRAAAACDIVNFHPSLLPRHRGHAPVIWAIAEGDEVTGVTAHRIDNGIDTGPVLYRRSLPIHPLDTGYQLHGKVALLVRACAAELLREWFRAGRLPAGLPQDGLGSLHQRQDATLNEIDWAWTGERVRNVVRALAHPLPGAWFRQGSGELVVINEAQPLPARRRKQPAGSIEIEHGEPVVWASDGPVKIAEAALGGVVVKGSELVARGLICPSSQLRV